MQRLAKSCHTVAATLLLLQDVVVASWIDDPIAQHDAFSKKIETPPLFTVNLDLPPEERWNAVYSDALFKNATQDLYSYFAANIPKWTIPILESIAKDTKGHFHDYGSEMLGIAKTLNAPVGEIVLVNLVYTLERVAASDCTMMNTTGPCKKLREGPGMCTSLVAEGPDGTTWHGRNLDWNLPDNLRKYIFDVDFTSEGKHLYRGTTIAGLVGLVHGARPGGFSVSLNARDDGGNPFTNLLEFVTGKHRTPTHLLREVLETQLDFDAGVKQLASTTLVDPVYYIVGGAKGGQGAVVSRDRRPPARDVWLLNQTSKVSPWFILETNYDHWVTPPSWDDRVTPAMEHMKKLGQAGVNGKGIEGILRQWPTFNPHTDITGIMDVTHGSFRTIVWRDDVPSKSSAARASEQMLVV